MDLVKSMMIAASGLKAQGGRMRVIAENMANAGSTAKTGQSGHADLIAVETPAIRPPPPQQQRTASGSPSI